jgi:hypothetical protein
VTLGALGGQVKPLTRAEVLKLAETSPVTNLVMLGRALGVSESVIRERACGAANWTSSASAACASAPSGVS